MAGSGALSAGTVSLAVKADTKGFGAHLAEGIRGEGGAISGIGKHLGGLLVAGLGAAGVAVGVGAILKTGFDEYKIADSLNAQFAAGIKSTGNAAHLSVKSMDDLASSIAGYSGQSYESIGKTEQLLQTFVNIKNIGPNKIFDQATTAAADMAAKMGGDASGMAIKLGKALNDPVKGMTALQRVGVMFTASQKDSIKAMVAHGDTVGAQKLILAELTKEFGGAAKAAGQTLPGSLGRGKVAFGELSKQIVEAVGPTVTNLVVGLVDKIKEFTPQAKIMGESIKKFLTDAFTTMKPTLIAVWDALKSLGSWITGTGVPAFSSLVGWLRDNSVWLTPIAVGVGAMLLAYKGYTAYLAIVQAATKAYAVVQGILNAVLAANPIGIIILAIVGLAAGLIYAYKTSETFRTVVNDVFHGVQVVIGKVVEVIITIFRDMLKVWTTVIGGLLSAAASVAETLHLPFAKSMRKASDAFNGMAKNADDKLKGVADSASHWGEQTGTNYAGGIKGGRPLVLTAAGVLAQTAKDKLLFNAQPQGNAVGDSYASGISNALPMVLTAAGRLADAAQIRLNSLTHIPVPGLAAPGRASGGPVTAGQPYIVGEHQPELFVPNVNGTIIPRVPTSTDGGGGGVFAGATSADIKGLGDRLEALGMAQTRMQQTMQRQMAGAR